MNSTTFKINSYLCEKIKVMTLKEYYEAFHKIEAPQGMPWYEEPQFFESEINKLRKHLSKEDLEEVLRRERHFYDKMQSSAGMGEIAVA